MRKRCKPAKIQMMMRSNHSEKLVTALHLFRGLHLHLICCLLTSGPFRHRFVPEPG
jgi:hypothetical protein